MPQAKEFWQLGRDCLSNEAKLEARANYLLQKAEMNSFPRWSLGLEQLPEYLNCVSDKIVEMQKKHAKELLVHASAQLLVKAAEYGEQGTMSLKTVKVLYQDDILGYHLVKKQIQDYIDQEKHKEIKMLANRNDTAKIKDYKSVTDDPEISIQIPNSPVSPDTQSLVHVEKRTRERSRSPCISSPASPTNSPVKRSQRLREKEPRRMPWHKADYNPTPIYLSPDQEGGVTLSHAEWAIIQKALHHKQ